MTIKDYITACNANIKADKMARAKKAFDFAWKEYAKGNYDDTDEKYLFWLRNNFYPRSEPVFLTDKGCRYEGMILEAAGN